MPRSARVPTGRASPRLRAAGSVGGSPTEAAFGRLGEVKYLYVATRCARQGIGRTLLARRAGRLAALGYGGIGLGVVVGNDPALAFYRALGARVAGRYTDPGPLWRSDNHLCVWDDALALARQGEDFRGGA